MSTTAKKPAGAGRLPRRDVGGQHVG